MTDQPWIRFGETFLVFLIGAIGLALWRSRQHIFTRDSLAPALLTALALLLRFVAHAGPGDIRSVLDWRGTGRAGWTVVLQLIRETGAPADETMYAINRVVGALAVPLLYAIVRRRFADPIVAIGAAAALAVTPLIVRFSATDTPYILLSAALLGAVVAFDAFLESGSLGVVALAFGLLTTAMQLRPEAAWLVVPVALLVLGHGGEGVPLARILRASTIVCALLFIALNVAPTLWALQGPTQGVSFKDFVLVGAAYHSPWADPYSTPRLLAALVLFGAVTAVFQYRMTGALWLVATLVALPFNMPAVAGPGITGYSVRPSVPVLVSQYANARYHIPAMYLACGLVGLGAAALNAWLCRLYKGTVPAGPLVVVGVICLSAAPRFDLLQRMWLPQREFELFREGLSRIHPRCLVVTLFDTGDAGFIPFRYLAPSPGRVIDVAQFVKAPPPHEDCIVYYRCANCYARDLVSWDEWATFEVNAACRALEERFQLKPIVEEQVAARPFRAEEYTRNPLPLGFYRLRERAPVAVGDITVQPGRAREDTPSNAAR